MQVAKTSMFLSAIDVIVLCWILYNKPRIVATFFFQWTTTFELFFIVRTLWMAAVINAFRFTATVSTTDSQAFNWLAERQAAKVFTYNSFVLVLRRHLASLGFDPKLYAGHSFRRGGASFAYHSGVPIELIKALGDWRSDTILIYLTMPLTVRLHSANMLCKAILRHNPHHSHAH